jgi:hypothetical protein
MVEGAGRHDAVSARVMIDLPLPHHVPGLFAGRRRNHRSLQTDRHSAGEGAKAALAASITCSKRLL